MSDRTKIQVAYNRDDQTVSLRLPVEKLAAITGHDAATLDQWLRTVSTAVATPFFQRIIDHLGQKG